MGPCRFPLRKKVCQERAVARDGIERVGGRGCDRELVRNARMIGEMLTDIGVVEHRRNPDRGQLFGRTNSREHEQLRSVDGARREDDLFGCIQMENWSYNR